MILYDKKRMEVGKRDRPGKTINLTIDEMPTRRIYTFKNPKEKKSFIFRAERVVRNSMEYREYMKFLKYHMDMNKCTVLRGLKTDHGRKYRIEIHHEPFSLFSIVEAVVNRRLEENQSLSYLNVADEVMELHYDGKIGLIPLTVTMHELVGNDKIFVPLQYVYQDYAAFCAEYEPYINPNVLEQVEAKAQLSLKTSDIVSDILDTEFVYVDVDGFKLPQIPKEWASALSTTATSSPLDED